jgi:hypothetical protein
LASCTLYHTKITVLINTAIQVAQAYPNTIVALSCRNEMGVNYGLVDAVAIAVTQCMTGLKAADIGQPIRSIDIY